MNRSTLRLAAVSAVAAVTLGAGAGLAQASQAAEARPAAAPAALSAADARALLTNPAVKAELKAEDTRALRAVADGTASKAQSRAAISGAVKALFNLMKRHGGKLWDDAVKAAKSGWGKFRSYMNGLSWYHPVRIAWVALGAEAQYQLYTYIRSLFA
ncbi:hypothetical protein ADL00_24230 [Streptomyces sp. AS58]|uniref:Secreted protein n=1 Tax=Streptomyces cadmiisoli TaxID=2184053 RepID=A0A2Z4J1X5_9ACTN|nr:MULTISPECIES: hypothetical protein [Streptomyces]AWW39185.1 hypothetical protein DN051_23080 [Streptomyces cadmiisoli]KOV61566.1 hypothetical protein ADL00_24230 [Streptomyces sp. AS58]